MLYLVSATPGTGKSCWVVKKLVEEFIEKPEYKGRPIYCNIAGLKIQGIKEPPDDFRECPDGSLIIYDEAQDIEYYNSDSRANNPVAKALSKHRHRGFDIWFITQDPSLLHKYVLKNVYLHYYLWRPAQRKLIEIFTFARAIVSPTKEDFKNAYDKTWWKFEEYYLQFYRSTVINTSKKVGSSKKWSVITTALIFFAMIAYFMYPAISASKKIKSPTPENSASTTAQTVIDVKKSSSATASTPLPASTVPPFQPVSLPVSPPVDNRVYGVAAFNGRCTAYGFDNQPLDISKAECLEYARGEKIKAVKTTIEQPQFSTQATLPPAPVASQPVPNLF